MKVSSQDIVKDILCFLPVKLRQLYSISSWEAQITRSKSQSKSKGGALLQVFSRVDDTGREA